MSKTWKVFLFFLWFLHPSLTFFFFECGPLSGFVFALFSGLDSSHLKALTKTLNTFLFKRLGGKGTKTKRWHFANEYRRHFSSHKNKKSDTIVGKKTCFFYSRYLTLHKTLIRVVTQSKSSWFLFFQSGTLPYPPAYLCESKIIVLFFPRG